MRQQYQETLKEVVQWLTSSTWQWNLRMLKTHTCIQQESARMMILLTCPHGFLFQQVHSLNHPPNKAQPMCHRNHFPVLQTLLAQPAQQRSQCHRNHFHHLQTLKTEVACTLKMLELDNLLKLITPIDTPNTNTSQIIEYKKMSLSALA